MGKFRKRPIEIEAVQIIEIIKADKNADWSRLPWWVANAFDAGGIGLSANHKRVYIYTLEGEMRAGINGWIVRGIRGELYPVEDSIFKETYEPVDTDKPEQVVAQQKSVSLNIELSPELTAHIKSGQVLDQEQERQGRAARQREYGIEPVSDEFVAEIDHESEEVTE